MSDCCDPVTGSCSHEMEHQMPEEMAARFEELAALEHEFEDVEEEISKCTHQTNSALAARIWGESQHSSDHFRLHFVA